jgi:hypothetical protein
MYSPILGNDFKLLLQRFCKTLQQSGVASKNCHPHILDSVKVICWWLILRHQPYCCPLVCACVHIAGKSTVLHYCVHFHKWITCSTNSGHIPDWPGAQHILWLHRENNIQWDPECCTVWHELQDWMLRELPWPSVQCILFWSARTVYL